MSVRLLSPQHLKERKLMIERTLSAFQQPDVSSKAIIGTGLWSPANLRL